MTTGAATTSRASARCACRVGGRAGRRASFWRERYALADGERELALIDAKSWGKRPVRVTIEDPASLDPALVLFAAGG